MMILLVFLALIVLTGLLFWRLTTQTSYRVKNRDEPVMQREGRSADRIGPDLRKMLD